MSDLLNRDEDNVQAENSRHPHIADMSILTLKELQEFYNKNLIGTTYVYEYEYKNKDEGVISPPIIHLNFNEWNMCHLLGIQHIVERQYNKNSYTGYSGYKKIVDNEMDIPTLKGISKSGFKAQKDRFKFFKCILDILQNPDLILYNSDLNSSNIQSKYIMYKLIGTSYIHLGIDIDENTVDYNPKIDKCYPRTLLIEKKMGTKFIINQKELILKNKYLLKNLDMF